MSLHMLFKNVRLRYHIYACDTCEPLFKVRGQPDRMPTTNVRLSITAHRYLYAGHSHNSVSSRRSF